MFRVTGSDHRKIDKSLKIAIALDSRKLEVSCKKETPHANNARTFESNFDSQPTDLGIEQMHYGRKGSALRSR